MEDGGKTVNSEKRMAKSEKRRAGYEKRIRDFVKKQTRPTPIPLMCSFVTFVFHFNEDRESRMENRGCLPVGLPAGGLPAGGM
jgi:hypothetical protein